MASGARKAVEDVLGGHMTAKVWTANYDPVLPFTPQGFSVGAVLPMVLYLFRWGHRRGKGKFIETFRSSSGKPTVRSVAERLAADPRFDGFDGGTGRIILSDLLLASVLENNRRREGHEEQVQRCFATHYMASWMDLPSDAAHLRGVPEAIVALVTDQRTGDVLSLDARNNRYPIGARVQENAFLKAFARGVTTQGQFRRDLTSTDQFDETAQIGLDQLLAVRIAQLCGVAPRKATGRGEPGPIPNIWPIARRAATTFREDLLTFFNAYGLAKTVPRQSLLPMLESAIAIGMTTILTATIAIVERWSQDGSVPPPESQRPWPVFIDCSMSTDPRLRDMSEQSSEFLRQRLARIPSALMYMRLLDFYLSIESDIAPRDRPPSVPDGTTWLVLLGSIASGSHEESHNAERFFRGKCRALAEAVKQDQSIELRGDILADEGNGRQHGERLAEVLTIAFEPAGKEITTLLSSALMTDEPNGLARRRRIRWPKALPGGRKPADVTSFVLTNTALEYLVHRHLRRTADPRKPEPLSLPGFLKILRERYGFHVDQSPPNTEAPNELLQRNRRVLEGRLRDLGLLVGVNDAERMKKLRTRYRSAYDRKDEIAEAVA